MEQGQASLAGLVLMCWPVALKRASYLVEGGLLLVAGEQVVEELFPCQRLFWQRLARMWQDLPALAGPSAINMRQT